MPPQKYLEKLQNPRKNRKKISLKKKDNRVQAEIRALLREGVSLLSNAGISDSLFESELLLAHVLGISRCCIYLSPRTLTPEHKRFFFSLIQRRGRRIPLAYLLRRVWFWKDSLGVGPGVLVPRPESEILIETSCEWCDYTQKNMILELCTGSGCLAIALGREFPSSTIYATDISLIAVQIASTNILESGLTNRIIVLHEDLFPSFRFRYDLILANPPYLSGKELSSADPELLYEPRQALYGGEDGLFFYRKILRSAPDFLQRGGFLIVEIPEWGAIPVASLAEEPLRLCEVRKDLAGKDRVLVFKKIPEDLEYC
jgi:release factor glutamine methyltransferase